MVLEGEGERAALSQGPRKQRAHKAAGLVLSLSAEKGAFMSWAILSPRRGSPSVFSLSRIPRDSPGS